MVQKAVAADGYEVAFLAYCVSGNLLGLIDAGWLVMLHLAAV
tara:strand:+ start:1025 stop:1150 length:126 start_codon:yes stop_codon:yes gene_type:complete